MIEKFDKDCTNTANILAEHLKFYSRKQRQDETLDQFITYLRILCSSCEFLNAEEMLRDQFALNIRDPRAKDKLIMEAQNNPRLRTFNSAVSKVKTCDSLNVRKDEEEMDSADKEEALQLLWTNTLAQTVSSVW